MLNRKVCKRLSQLEIVLQEVEEGNIVRGHSHHNFVFLFKGLEAFNSALNFLVLYKMNSLLDLHFRLHFRQVGCLQSSNNVVKALKNVALDDGRNQLSRR